MKQKIIDTTLRLVSEHGLENTPISLIAREANIAAGSIYVHFEHKADLLQAIYQFIADEIAQILSNGISPDDDERTRYYAVWLTLFKYFM